LRPCPCFCNRSGGRSCPPPSQGQAVDGDHALRYSGDRRHPGGEAALELFGIQRGQDIAEVIVRGRAVAERAEAAEQIPLFHPEDGNIGDGLGARQHGEQAEEKDLLKRVTHFASLPGVVEVLEIAQKNDGFRERLASGCRAVHADFLNANRRKRIESASRWFVTYSFTRSP